MDIGFFDKQTILLDQNGATICDLEYKPQRVVSITDAMELLGKGIAANKLIPPQIAFNQHYNVVYYHQNKNIITVILEYSPRTWKVNWYSNDATSINLPYIYISAKYKIGEDRKPKLFRYEPINKHEYIDQYNKYFKDNQTSYGSIDYLTYKKNICVKIGMSPTRITNLSDLVFFTFLPNFFQDLHICWPGNARIDDPIEISHNLIGSTHTLAIKAISVDQGNGDANGLNVKIGLGLYTEGDGNATSQQYYDFYQKYLDSKKYLYGVPMEYLL